MWFNIESCVCEQIKEEKKPPPAVTAAAAAPPPPPLSGGFLKQLVRETEKEMRHKEPEVKEEKAVRSQNSQNAPLKTDFTVFTFSSWNLSLKIIIFLYVRTFLSFKTMIYTNVSDFFGYFSKIINYI